MNRTHVITAVLVLVLIGLGLWWWKTFELKEVTRRLPLTGEARINPLYGLQTILRERGLEVQTQAQFRAEGLPAQPGLVVMSADLRSLSESASETLLDWVEGGGQLLVALPPSDGGRAPLLEYFDLWTLESHACIDWKYPAPPAAQKAAKRARGSTPVLPSIEELFDTARSLFNEDRWCGSESLQLGDDIVESDFDWLYGNSSDGWLLARLAHGGGQITFASQLDFLHTRPLRVHANAAFAWQLLAPALGAEPEVLLVYAADLPPLHVLIVRHGWAILLPLLLGLLAWMWMRSQRFGPLQPEVAVPRRALREHLRAAAELALRRRQGSALLKPLRQRVLQTVALSEPEIAALPARELAQALAAKHSLSPIAVEQALFDIRIERPAALADAVRTLHRLSLRP